MKKNSIIISVVVAGMAANIFNCQAYAEQKDIAIRSAIENMQGQIQWNAQSKSVGFSISGVTGEFMLNSNEALINGQKLMLDKAFYGLNGTTYVSENTYNQILSEVTKAQNKTGLELKYSFQMPGGKAEILYSTPDGKKLVVTEADLGSIAIVSIEDMNNIKLEKSVSLKSLSDKAEVTSVTVTPDGNYALAAVRGGDDINNANMGYVAVISLESYEIVKSYEVGIGPDSIAISKDGKYAVIAIEDEEINKELDEIEFSKVKRPGSIAVLAFPDKDVKKGELTNIAIDLSNVGNSTVYKNDVQPEYVAINEACTIAAVTLQENNAIAIIDLNEKKLKNVFGLGTTSHKADLKDDDKVQFSGDLTARPEPDGIAFTTDGKYLVTANEGDLGKNEFDDKVMAGGRNISVWDLDGKLIYDSMDLIDRVNAVIGRYPDGRSGKKGSEVENLTVAKINGKEMLAVASERSSTILFFDLADVKKPAFLGAIPCAGESPEGIHKISGRDIFVSADESTGTLSFYGLK